MSRKYQKSVARMILAKVMKNPIENELSVAGRTDTNC